MEKPLPTMNHPILIAEDNPVSRSLLEKILLKAGHEVVCAKNGLEALELYEKQFFPLVLTDWMMPGMDGLGLCRAIRKNISRGYVFIVLLTSRDSKKDIVTGLEAGADDYLIKPFDPAELIARIKTGLRILNLESSLRKANEEIRLLSVMDHLTGCYNRGYITKNLPVEIKKARRFHHDLSVLLCDIDHFKAVNDSRGHQTGDLVLREFVRLIGESIRSDIDWVARYGGEEFLIVLPETGFEGAVTLGQRLCSEIASSAIRADGTEIHITASFGITAVDSEAWNKKVAAEALINRADELLYQAKGEGRNRIKSGVF